MGIFGGWFKEGTHKADAEIVAAKVMEPDEQIVTFAKTVEVADIRQYLLDEYQRNSALTRDNESLKSRLEGVKGVEHERDAALVTLSEYERRLKDAEREIKRLNDKLSQQGQTVKEQRDEINRLTIEGMEIERRVSVEAARAWGEFANAAKSAIRRSSGNLSKQKAIDLVDEVLRNKEEREA